MRQGQQHRRGRGRNNQNNNNNNNHNHNNQHGQRKGQNPLTRSFESNGPDVKVRGTPAHVAEKYLQLARDAQSSGDHVLAENYLQHAEHYNRIILVYREQQIQQSGEQQNGGGGRPFHQRSDGNEGDEQGGDDGNNTMRGNDQPYMSRGEPGEQPTAAGDQPIIDDQRSQRHGEHSGRFRDRHRGDRGEGYERPERQGGRGFDRQRDRPAYQSRDRDGDQPGAEQRTQREPRETREMDGNRVDRVEAPPAVEAHTPVEARPERPERAQRAERSETSPRRRERFGLSSDQPEFLRRPVRRSRRDQDVEAAPEAPPATDDSPRE